MSLGQWSLDLEHGILGIKSPSRALFDYTWDKLIIDGADWPPAPQPWYSARDPRDAYESPELRNAARRVRRLIRRYWFALLFEPDSPIALSVREAMAHPPEREAYSDLRLAYLIGSMKLTVDPKVARDFAEQCGVKWES